MSPFKLSCLALLCLQLWSFSVLHAQEETATLATVDSLIQVSRSHTAQADFDAAFVASAQAGKLAKECCGEHSVGYANFCFNEGRIRYFLSRNKEAIPWYLQAKALRAELLGTMHIDYGKSLNNLAVAYEEMGQFSKAEPLYLESLKVREHTAGRESTTYAKVLYNLSGFYLEIGRLEQAEEMGLEAKEIRANLLGEGHVEYAATLINLANIYYKTNNSLRALDLYLEAKAIYEKQEDLPFYSYARVLDNLGAVYQQLRDYGQAESYYQQSAELRLDALGEENEDYALNLNHLAAVYFFTDRFEEAEEALRKSLAILERLGHEDDNDYAYSLQDLGNVYFFQNKHPEALELQKQALGIISQQFQKHHPRYLRGLRFLAKIEADRGRFSTAADYLCELAQWEEKTLNSAVRHLSEEELNNFTVTFKEHLHQYLILVEDVPTLTNVCYDKLLTYKGFLQTQALQVQQLAQRDSLLNTTYLELRDLHLQLGSLYTSAGASEDRIQALEEAAYEVEKQLVKRSVAIGEIFEEVTWESVRDALAPNSAAIEFIEYKDNDSAGEPRWRYAALLVLPSAELPIFVPLCQAEALAQVLEQSSEQGATFINRLYNEQGTALYKLLWAPIEEVLAQQEETETIHFSSAGLLHRLNLGAIPGTATKRLAEKYQFLQLGSTRQLVFPHQYSPAVDTTNSTAVLYGGITYGTTEGNMANTAVTLRETAGEDNAVYPRTRGYDAANGHWQPLTWTEVEIVTAEEFLSEAGYSTVVKSAEAATETYFKSMLSSEERSPGVLHLATHGYFFPDEVATGNTLVFRDAEDAMIRSGLVLADGNYAWVHGQPRESGKEDGILTAYEVNKMDLRQTELVILSACETGLGDIKGTEGVYGLQRAFKIAGARYLIMTLWQVPDYETQAFMTTFYLAWLDEGKSIPEAFQAAQNYMRARYKEPFKWAGFQLIE